MDFQSWKIQQRQSRAEENAIIDQLQKECKTQAEFEAKFTQLMIQPMLDRLQQSNPGIPTPSFDPTFKSIDEDLGDDSIDQLISSLTNSNPAHSSTIQVVRERVPKLVNEIYDDWQKLQFLVPHYLSDIRHRWVKRTTEKRKRVLLDAWPAMPAGHRPDFQALRRSLKGPSYRDAWMTPQINLEDLSKPSNLLLLLESRASEQPSYFSWSDSAPSQMAAHFQAVEVLDVWGYTMLLSGESSRKTYGKLVAWRDDHSSITKLATGLGFQIGEGLNILETQRKIYHFLVRCTELLLPDKNPTISNLTSGTLLTEKMVSRCVRARESENPEWTSISEMNTEAAYRKPQQFALDRLRKLAAAKRDEAEDEFWFLRENPIYFREAIEERYLQCQEVNRVLARDTGILLRLDAQECYMHEACRCVIQDSCRSVIFWDLILIDLERLEELHANHGVQPMQPLPQDYHRAMTKFTVLESFINDEANVDIYNVVAMSPPLRQYFKFAPMPEGGLGLQLKDGESEQIPSILSLLNDLVDPGKVAVMGATNILDEVERLKHADPSQRALIDTRVARKISEMAAFAEVADALSQHQPKIEISVEHDESVRLAKKRLMIVRYICTKSRSLKLGKDVQPASSFDYPLHKAVTEQAVNKLRTAEAKLDRFWEQVDQHFLKHGGKTLTGWMGGRITTRQLERTPPWESSRYFRAPKAAANSTSNVTSNSPEVEPQVKAKTRGLADPLKAGLVGIGTDREIDDSSHQHSKAFQLPNKAFKTMRAFFPVAEQEYSSGKVLWKDFVQSMSKLGFSIKSMDGSAWYFEPTWKQSAPITIHEPHPSHEIGLARLRFYASRLARKYGWSSQSFELV